ncbi:MAG: response regulator transcription factor [Bacillota bacterium]
MSKIRVMVVDDHEVVRVGLVTLLRRQQSLEVVAEAGSSTEAVSKAKFASPDVVIMDVRMPGGSGIDTCREIQSLNPQTKVIMLSSFGDQEAVVESIAAGAVGYVLKQVGSQALIEAVIKVAQGECILDPGLTRMVFEHMKKVEKQAGLENMLTDHERHILALIGEGLPNKEIAKKVFLSEKTVRNYVSNILSKMNFSNRSQAAIYATKKGKHTQNG